MPREGVLAQAALPTVKEIMGRRKAATSVNEQHQASLSALERLALWITEHVGTMGFFLIILGWTVGWMGWNYFAQKLHLPGVFDTPWEFGIWLFISNLIQIHLMPLIMVGQNLQARHSELRADQAFETTEQTEYETEAVLRYLEVICGQLDNLDRRMASLESGAQG